MNRNQRSRCFYKEALYVGENWTDVSCRDGTFIRVFVHGTSWRCSWTVDPYGYFSFLSSRHVPSAMFLALTWPTMAGKKRGALVILLREADIWKSGPGDNSGPCSQRSTMQCY